MRNTWEVLQKSGGKIRKLYFFSKMSKKSKNIREFAKKNGFFVEKCQKNQKILENLQQKLGFF